MTEDHIVQQTGLNITVGKLRTNPYLLYLNHHHRLFFISLDKPNISSGYIEVKGLLYTADDKSTIENDEFLIENYLRLLNETPKENFLEVIFPSYQVTFMRSLTYKAK